MNYFPPTAFLHLPQTIAFYKTPTRIRTKPRNQLITPSIIARKAAFEWHNRNFFTSRQTRRCEKKRKAIRSFLTLRGKRITRGAQCEREIKFFLYSTRRTKTATFLVNKLRKVSEVLKCACPPAKHTEKGKYKTALCFVRAGECDFYWSSGLRSRKVNQPGRNKEQLSAAALVAGGCAMMLKTSQIKGLPVRVAKSKDIPRPPFLLVVRCRAR